MSDESREMRGLTSESEPEARMNRRNFLGTLAGGIAIAGAPYVITRRANAQAMRTIRFSEAVHNLGYIDLYVARDKGLFKEQNIDLQLSAATDPAIRASLWQQRIALLQQLGLLHLQPYTVAERARAVADGTTIL